MYTRPYRKTNGLVGHGTLLQATSVQASQLVSYITSLIQGHLNIHQKIMTYEYTVIAYCIKSIIQYNRLKYCMYALENDRCDGSNNFRVLLIVLKLDD